MVAKEPSQSAVSVVPLEVIERRIYILRGHKVMIDSNLAELYRLVVMERAPVHAVSALCWGVDREIEVHQLLLPLSESGTEPAIALIGIALRSDEVFPPQIRSLHGVCHFEERRKTKIRAPEFALSIPFNTPSRGTRSNRV